VDKGRKRVILIAPSIRRCAEAGTVRRREESSGDPQRNRGFGALAEEIMKAIEERWPAGR